MYKLLAGAVALSTVYGRHRTTHVPTQEATVLRRRSGGYSGSGSSSGTYSTYYSSGSSGSSSSSGSSDNTVSSGRSGRRSGGSSDNTGSSGRSGRRSGGSGSGRRSGGSSRGDSTVRSSGYNGNGNDDSYNHATILGRRTASTSRTTTRSSRSGYSSGATTVYVNDSYYYGGSYNNYNYDMPEGRDIEEAMRGADEWLELRAHELDDAVRDIGDAVGDVSRDFVRGLNDLDREVGQVVRDIENVYPRCPWMVHQSPFDAARYSGGWYLFRQTYDNTEFYKTKTGKCNYHRVDIHQEPPEYQPGVGVIMHFYSDQVYYADQSNSPDPRFTVTNQPGMDGRAFFENYELDYLYPYFHLTFDDVYPEEQHAYSVVNTDYETYSIVSNCAEQLGEPAKENLWIYTREPVSPDDYDAQNALMNTISERLLNNTGVINTVYDSPTGAEDRVAQLLQNLGPITENPLNDDVMCGSRYSPDFQRDE